MSIGNADDLQVGTFAIAELGADEEVTETREVTIPQDTLLAQALEEDLPGQGLDYVSGNVGYLALVVDPENQLGELDESNNFNRGQGVDFDDITYFPWDLNGSGRVTPTDLVSILNRLGGDDGLADLDGDGTVTGSDALLVRDRLGYTRNEAVFEDIPEVLTVEISPTDGEEMVSLTRETIVRFGGTVQEETVTSESFYLIANGSRVEGEIRVSSTGEFATFFYDEPLPASTEVRVVVEGDQILATDGTAIDGDGDGVAGGTGTADFRTLPLTQIEGTNVFGFVFDSNNTNPDGSDIPIAGVRIQVVGLPDLFAITDETGFFRLENVPAPEFFVEIEPSEATSTAITGEGQFYSSITKPLFSVAGQELQIQTEEGEPFEIFLPLITEEDFTLLSTEEETSVGFGPQAIEELEEMFPDIEPETWERLEVVIPPNSLSFDDGTPVTEVSVVPLPTDRIPAPVPEGANPAFVFTVDAKGATNVDGEAQLVYPNVDGLAPGEQRFIFSFDHDAGEWVPTGTVTVSDDGLTLVSDPDSGVTTLGWRYIGPEPVVEIKGEVKEPNEKTQDSLLDEGIGLARNTAALFLNGISFLSSIIDNVPILGQIPLVDQGLSGITGLAGQLADVIDDGEIGAGTWASTGIALAGTLDPEPITGSILDAAGLALGKQSLFDSANATAEAGRDFIDALTGAQSDWSQTIGDIADKVEEFTTQINLFLEGLESIRQAREAANAQATSDPAIVAQFIDGVEKIIQVSEFFAGQESGSAEISLGTIKADYQDFQQHFEEMFADIFRPAAQSQYSVALQDGTIVARGVTNGVGRFSAVLPANQTFLVTVANAVSNQVVTTFLNSGLPGNSLRESLFLAPTLGIDTDGEGLLDEVEQVLGTNPNLVDTDEDGIDDLTEVQQGLSPLDNQDFPTGIVASLTLQGEANEVSIVGSTLEPTGQTAYIATGSHGLAIVDASEFSNPIIVSQLDLPGTATDVAVDASLNIAVVAAGAEGLHLVDITDSGAPSLQTTLDINASQVEVLDGLVYTSVGSQLRTYDLLDGSEVESLFLDGTIQGLAKEGEFLYAVTANQNLHVIDLSTTSATLRSSIELPDIAQQIFVGNGIAYIANGREAIFVEGPNPEPLAGYMTVDVTDPDTPTLISGIDTPQVQSGNLKTVTNGSGLAVVAGGFRGLQIHNASTPDTTYDLITEIPTPGEAQSVAVAGGIAYVADGTGGLQIINYLSFDSQGQAPTVTISTPSDIDTNTEGIQVLEGANIPIIADVEDDVQVRNVELLVNGEVVSNDVSFPFDLAAIALSDDPDATTVEVQARATDTGGNTALSNLLALDLIPDTSAPVIESITPADGGTAPFNSRRVTVRFNKALAEETVNTENFQLLDADGEVITPENIQLRSGDRTVQLTYEALLPREYSIVINSSQVTDRAGNPLGEEDAVSLFTVTRQVEFNLSDLDGSNGFVLNGIDRDDFSGRSVSGAGDINGDGFDDLIIGATGAEPNGNSSAGETYVVFGTDEGFAASFDLSNLDGSNGFVLNGIDSFDRSGYSVSGAGDINGDGFDDLIIGATGAEPNGNSSAGETYVVFGTDEGFAASFDLSNLDGSNGFVLNGIDRNDLSGGSVSGAGDINGDGFDDLIIGARRADPNGNSGAGETYVVFGTDEGFAASFDLSNLNGSNGFLLNGINSSDGSGNSVSGVGDVNGDGFDDLIIGAYRADPNGNRFAGETYVVFGTDEGFAASFDLSNLDGSNGFVLNGIDRNDLSGGSVSGVGDVNGDGFDDLIIGALSANPNGNVDAGETYVVFGTDEGFAASFDLSNLNGSNGFLLNGIDSSDESGRSVSGAGDINGDGFDDLIIGAYHADPNGNSRAGETYVVFGTDEGFAASFDLSNLNGSNGFLLNGIDGLDYSGNSVSGAGDINGDGFDDLIIGADRAEPNSNFSAGETYVVFGSPAFG